MTLGRAPSPRPLSTGRCLARNGNEPAAIFAVEPPFEPEPRLSEDSNQLLTIGKNAHGKSVLPSPLFARVLHDAVNDVVFDPSDP
jgi:hypothetical protein